MITFFRRLWGKTYVELTRVIGEGEVLKISFNENSSAQTTERLHTLLDFLDERMRDHNRRVAEAMKRDNVQNLKR